MLIVLLFEKGSENAARLSELVVFSGASRRLNY